MSVNFIRNHPYIAAIIAAVICTFLTAVGSAAAQIADLGEVPGYLVMASSVALSVLAGLLLLRRSDLSTREIGFRRLASGSVRSVWFCVPLLLMEVIPLTIYGPTFARPGAEYAALALLTVVVGLNEELYFRGLSFSFLLGKSRKQAVIGSSIIFGVLHAANALSSATQPVEVLLQIIFAFLVGLTLALIVSITRSLWVGIVWHFVHNFISFSTELALDRTALIVITAQVLILMVYTVGLWKRGTAGD
ncbi:CAAX amino terminal protease self- immunity [compost metagenome]